ncbi:OmpH family outer membrane protein [Roseiflexus sp. AH-315-K22]|nr:OmpH family outer membrane protein [Roseiflexus sp. AH-315-K22]
MLAFWVLAWGGARFGTVSACLVLAAASVGNAQSQNQTQNQSESDRPSYVVVTSDAVQLRCGPGGGFYATRELNAGQVLRVAEQGGQWLKVRYPGSSEAYVAADAVAVTGDVATLLSERSLRHVNPRTGKRGSWKPLYDAPLPRGTRLSVVAFEDSTQPQHKAYRVRIPSQAQAYIEGSAVRPASADEVSLYLATISEADILGADPIRRDVVQVNDGNGTLIDASAPGSADQTIAPPQLAPQNADLRLGTPSQLEATFQAVRAQPGEEAEYEELIAEYRRAIESLDERPANEPLRLAYQQRLDFLQMQRRFQEARQAASRSLSDLENNSKAIADALSVLDETRRYAVIGRLTTSVVYDGERLPLMYRIQSVGDRVPRTLGYIKPSKAYALSAKVGRIVGIEGKTLLDQSLKLNVVTPTRVDVLTPTADGTLQREAPPTPEPSVQPDASGDATGDTTGDSPAAEPKKSEGG